jgi:chlorophyll synthase
MALPQFIVVALLFSGWGETYHAVIVSVFLAVQLALMVRLLEDPRRLAPWYNATGVSLYVLGMLVSAFALRHGLAASA